MVHDMTKGPVLSALVRFTIPLILGNILQLTYNAADSMIVGRWLGKEALAAVGTANPFMTLILLFTNGICLGAGILAGFHYGAKEEETLKSQVSTGMIAGVVFSLAAGAVISLFAGNIMALMQVDPGIIPLAARYLRIIMIGLVFSFVYNYLASMLRAMGDSRSPLYFLAVSAALNILGDILLVVVLRMGTAGAAVSTVLCEAFSAVLCWVYVYRRILILRMGKRWLHFDAGLLKITLSYGIVSALQQSSVQIGKLMVQAFVNSLGITSAAAFNATNRVDDFAIIPEQNIAHAVSSVMAQNVGAGEWKRVRAAFRCGIGIEACFGAAAGLVMYFLAEPVMRLFASDPEVITEGVKFLHLMAFLCPMPAMTNGIQGYFRGVGDLKVTLLSSILNMTGRVICCFVLLMRFHMGFHAVPWSYMTGWCLMLLFEIPYLVFSLNKSRRGAVNRGGSP